VDSVNFDRAAAFYDATRALPEKSMTELADLLAGTLAADRENMPLDTVHESETASRWWSFELPEVNR